MRSRAQTGDYLGLTRDIFDEGLSRYLREKGMEQAAASEARVLDLARAIAVTIAESTNRLCHADQVGWVLRRLYGIDSLGPAAGSMFKDGRWEFTGKRIDSVRVSNHARELKIWRLKDE